MADSYSGTYPNSMVFLFDGPMPTSMESLPFAPTLNNFIANSVNYFSYTSLNINGKGRLSVTENTTESLNNFYKHYSYDPSDTYRKVWADSITWSNGYIDPDYAVTNVPNNWSNKTRLDRLRMLNMSEAYTQFGYRDQRYIMMYYPQEYTFNAIRFKQTRYGYEYGGGRADAYLWAQTLRVIHWDQTLNEGSGGWTNAQGTDYSVGYNNDNLFSLNVPITTKAICLYGAEGQWGYHPGHTVYGDPRWRVYYAQGLSSQPATSAEHDVTWAIVFPCGSDFFDTLGSEETLITRYNSGMQLPYIIADVGTSGSGAALELINNPVPDEQRPQINNFNLQFSS